MEFQLNIDCENDAFADGNARREVARILRQTADDLEEGNLVVLLHDVNGNRVGVASLTPAMK